MTDQPVTPDREALIRASVEGRLAAHPGITPHLRHVVAEAYRDEAEPFVDALLPLLADALDRARQQGRNEAADAIEAERDRLAGEPWQVCEVYGIAVRLARGGPNRKDEE